MHACCSYYEYRRCIPIGGIGGASMTVGPISSGCGLREIHDRRGAGRAKTRVEQADGADLIGKFHARCEGSGS